MPKSNNHTEIVYRYRYPYPAAAYIRINHSLEGPPFYYMDAEQFAEYASAHNVKVMLTENNEAGAWLSAQLPSQDAWKIPSEQLRETEQISSDFAE